MSKCTSCLLASAVGIPVHGIVEHHRAERVREAFAERHSQVQPVAERMVTADAVGAAQPVLDVVLEFVGDDVLVVFVGIRSHAEVGIAEHVDPIADAALERVIARGLDAAPSVGTKSDDAMLSVLQYTSSDGKAPV